MKITPLVAHAQNETEENRIYLNGHIEEDSVTTNSRTTALFHSIVGDQSPCNEPKTSPEIVIYNEFFSQKEYPSLPDDLRQMLIATCAALAIQYKLPLHQYIVEAIQKYNSDPNSQETKQFLLRAQDITFIPEDLFQFLKEENKIVNLLKCCPNLLITIHLESSNREEREENIDCLIPAKIVMDMSYFTSLMGNTYDINQSIFYKKEGNTLLISTTYNNELEREAYTAFFELLQKDKEDLKNSLYFKNNDFSFRKVYLIRKAALYFGLTRIIDTTNYYIKDLISQRSIQKVILALFHEIANKDEQEVFTDFKSAISSEKKYLFYLFLHNSIMKFDLFKKFLEEMGIISQFPSENSNFNKEIIAYHAFIEMYSELEANDDERNKLLTDTDYLLSLFQDFPDLRIAIKLHSNNREQSESISYTIPAKIVMDIEYFTALLRNINNVKEVIGYEKEEGILSIPLTYENQQEKEIYIAFFEFLQNHKNNVTTLVYDKNPIDSLHKLLLIRKAADYFKMEQILSSIKSYIENCIFSAFSSESVLVFFNKIASENEKEIFNEYLKKTLNSNVPLSLALFRPHKIFEKYKQEKKASDDTSIDLVTIFDSNEIMGLVYIEIYNSLKKDHKKVEKLLIEDLNLHGEEERAPTIKHVKDILQVAENIPNFLPELVKNSDFLKKLFLTFKGRACTFFNQIEKSVKAILQNDEEILQYFFGPESEENAFDTFNALESPELLYNSNVADAILRQFNYPKNQNDKEDIIEYIRYLNPQILEHTEFTLKLIASAIPIDVYVNKIGESIREKLVKDPNAIKKIVDSNNAKNAIQIITGSSNYEFQNAPLFIRNNIDIAYAQLRSGSSVEHFVENQIWDNREFVREAVLLNGSNLQYASENLKNDFEFLDAILTRRSRFVKEILSYASEKVRDNPKLAFVLLQIDSSKIDDFLQLSDRIRNNNFFKKWASKKYKVPLSRRLHSDFFRARKLVIKIYYSSSVPESEMAKEISFNGRKYEYIENKYKHFSIFKKIKLIASTLFSLGLRLFSTSVQAKWRFIFHNQKVTALYVLKEE